MDRSRSRSTPGPRSLLSSSPSPRSLRRSSNSVDEAAAPGVPDQATSPLLLDQLPVRSRQHATQRSLSTPGPVRPLTQPAASAPAPAVTEAVPTPQPSNASSRVVAASTPAAAADDVAAGVDTLGHSGEGIDDDEIPGVVDPADGAVILQDTVASNNLDYYTGIFMALSMVTCIFLFHAFLSVRAFALAAGVIVVLASCASTCCFLLYQRVDLLRLHPVSAGRVSHRRLVCVPWTVFHSYPTGTLRVEQRQHIRMPGHPSMLPPGTEVPLGLGQASYEVRLYDTARKHLVWSAITENQEIADRTARRFADALHVGVHQLRHRLSWNPGVPFPSYAV